MKRLVVCCDGTWNRPDTAHVTNVEKIARTVATDLGATAGVQQLVLYLSGVGVGYHVDRVLGGAFGLGLFTNVLAGYRYLALNYEPGDEVYVLGFSRGAYTARSLVGMIGQVGLLTRTSLVDERLPEAVALYRGRRRDATGPGGSTAVLEREAAERFRTEHCHPATPIRFLGVFDTVGALGVPGALRRRHQFHDVRLSDAVQCARQALAIDERRMKFEPCLWEAPQDGPRPGVDERVRQVWFEGAHSDVGGGYAESGLSDTALLWMAGEAARAGLVFDEGLLARYVASGSPAVRHDSMTPLFWLLDQVIRTKIRLGIASGRAFLGRCRRLDRPDCLSVRVGEAAADRFRTDAGYRPVALVQWSRTSTDFTACVEPVVGLPVPSYDVAAHRLADRGITLGPR